MQKKIGVGVGLGPVGGKGLVGSKVGVGVMWGMGDVNKE